MADRFRVLFDHSSDPHLIFDADGGITDCNDATIDLLGAQSREQVLALHPAQLSPSMQPCGQPSEVLAAEMDGIARRNGFHRFEWLHQRIDGTPLPVEVTLNAVELDGSLTMLVVWHDLTARKKLDAERLALTNELQRANMALQAANDDLRRDLEAARAAQRSLLPAEGVAEPLVDVSWVFRPCETLGGDLFGVFILDDSRVGFFVLDVSGHGVESSLCAAAAHRLLLPRSMTNTASNQSTQWSSPAHALAQFNRAFCIDAVGTRFVTALCGILDTAHRTLTCASAGHPPPILLRSGDSRPLSCSPRLPVGIVPDEDYHDHPTKLRRGDRVVLFTDCAFEARSIDGEFFGHKRLERCLRDNAGRSLRDQLGSAERDVVAWCPGAQPADDLTLLGLEVK